MSAVSWPGCRSELVIETLRPLPIAPLAAAPAFVSGSAIVRGEPLPVVSLGRLLSDTSGEPGRFVVIRAGTRNAVLSVDSVLGFRDVPAADMTGLPPLLAARRRRQWLNSARSMVNCCWCSAPRASCPTLSMPRSTTAWWLRE